jgi:protease-4
MKKFWIVFLVVALIVGGGLGLLWRAVSSLESPSVVANVLRWQAGGPYAEAPPEGFLDRLQAGDGPTFSELVFGLRRAAGDPAVDTLLLDLRGVQANWAQLEELHEAIADFRTAGKTLWAYIESGGGVDYAIACAADRVALAPEGSLMVLGVVAEMAFLKDTLGKVGVEADFVHVGKYKSAPEQLTRREPTEANREMMEALVESRYELLVDLIARGRGVDRRRVRQWIDVGMFDGESALAAGLVDTLLDGQELVASLTPDGEPACLSRYVRRSGGGGARHEIALIVAAGTIYPGESRRDNLQGLIMGSDTVVEQLRAAREDADIEAVLLRVDSPGGSALASDLIWREVERVQAVKPVVVSMGGYAASGGYYISCGADSIFAGAGTLTGSIGVFAGKMDMSGLYDKIELHREFITRGENALFWRDAGEFTPAQRAQLQDQLDRFYERFLAKVAAGRGLDRDQVHAVAQGRVWTGRQALAAGLVDGIGGLDRALDAVRSLVGAGPEEKLLVHTYREPLSWLERTMLDALRSRAARLDALSPVPGGALPGPLADAARGLARAGLLDVAPLLDGRPLTLLPWRELERSEPSSVRP